MLLHLENISKSFGKSMTSTHQQVLQHLSLKVKKGESIAVLGPSGSGKSTLLNIVGAMDIPDSGSYRYKDEDITEYSGNKLDHFRNREIGFIFQFHHLLPQCNILENVLIPSLVNREERKEKRAYAEELLNRVGLWEHKHKVPSQLSGGECQRVAVVRAMINSPSLLLADEPTGALDKKNVARIAELLLKLNVEDKLALMLVTHSKSLASQMNTIYELEDGLLVKR